MWGTIKNLFEHRELQGVLRLRSFMKELKIKITRAT